MSEILEFTQIKYESIFEPEYNNLSETENDKIEFKMQPQASGGVAVIYAPNGTGKTSLCEVLACEEPTADKMFTVQYNGTQITGTDKKFHLIRDQITRNVIPGDTSDYLIGANIRREYELKKRIAEGFAAAFTNIPKILKVEYKITKIGDYLLNCFNNTTAVRYLRDILPTRYRGRNIDRNEFVQFISTTARVIITDTVNNDKINFIINDCAGAKLIEKIASVSIQEIVANEEVMIIGQNDDAIGLLNKYNHLQTCIVCDNQEFNANLLLERKIQSRQRIYDSLDDRTKELLDKVVNDNSLIIADPFCIRDNVTSFISTGMVDDMNTLKEEINLYISFLTGRILNVILSCFDGSSMLLDFAEYADLLENQPEIESEEFLFIQEIISENIGPEITFVRDEENDRNFKLMLGGHEFLGVERKKLHLSNGEQNFISLAFELLLARKSDREFIVMDDPISSFDSVYKNKIAFCIVKFLEHKKHLIFTHNTDLIRLLEVQQNGCFNLYLFNNASNGNNGFIQVNNAEKELLINLHKLIKLLQNQNNTLSNIIVDERQFLLSMVPFMRGYAHISKDGDEIYTLLSGVMHGYETAAINVTDVYESLFGYRFTTDYIISSNDILSLDCITIDILDKGQYPLLAETLRQTLVYYYLRMKVEKELVEIFNLTINPTHPPMLNQIIRRAFNYTPTDADAERKREYKVFFTSRKTLLNEFNHFEGNMNIFQPAIDIESGALQREITLIEGKLVNLRTDYTPITLEIH